MSTQNKLNKIVEYGTQTQTDTEHKKFEKCKGQTYIFILSCQAPEPVL